MEEVRKSRPCTSTLTELKAVADAFAERVEPKEVRRSARSTWHRARVCRAVADASFEDSLKKVLKGQEHQRVSKCPAKLSLDMTEKITLSGKKGLILRILLLTVILTTQYSLSAPLVALMKALHSPTPKKKSTRCQFYSCLGRGK